IRDPPMVLAGACYLAAERPRPPDQRARRSVAGRHGLSRSASSRSRSCSISVATRFQWSPRSDSSARISGARTPTAIVRLTPRSHWSALYPLAQASGQPSHRHRSSWYASLIALLTASVHSSGTAGTSRPGTMLIGSSPPRRDPPAGLILTRRRLDALRLQERVQPRLPRRVHVDRGHRTRAATPRSGLRAGDEQERHRAAVGTMRVPVDPQLLLDLLLQLAVRGEFGLVGRRVGAVVAAIRAAVPRVGVAAFGEDRLDGLAHDGAELGVFVVPAVAVEDVCIGGLAHLRPP